MLNDTQNIVFAILVQFLIDHCAGDIFVRVDNRIECNEYTHDTLTDLSMCTVLTFVTAELGVFSGLLFASFAPMTA